MVSPLDRLGKLEGQDDSVLNDPVILRKLEDVSEAFFRDPALRTEEMVSDWTDGMRQLFTQLFRKQRQSKTGNAS